MPLQLQWQDNDFATFGLQYRILRSSDLVLLRPSGDVELDHLRISVSSRGKLEPRSCSSCHSSLTSPLLEHPSGMQSSSFDRRSEVLVSLLWRSLPSVVTEVRRCRPYLVRDEAEVWKLLKAAVVVGIQHTRMPAVISTHLKPLSEDYQMISVVTYVVSQTGMAIQVLSLLLTISVRYTKPRILPTHALESCRLCFLFRRQPETDIDPVRNINDTPTFLRNGSCKDHTAGRGNIVRYKSLTTFTTPVIVIRGRVLVHRGEARALMYANWEWPFVGPHITRKATIDAK